MGKEHLQQDMERVLQQDVVIPECVERKIAEAYAKIEEENQVISLPATSYRKSKKLWKVVAAVAVLTIGTSAVGIAASHFLSVGSVKNGKEVSHQILVDKEQKAHKVNVTPTYMPEGYVYMEDGPYGGKWRNELEDSSIMITAYNAAELDRMIRTGQDVGFRYFTEKHQEEQVIAGDDTLELYTGEDFYLDSEKTVKQLYLFNQKHGYGIWISSRSELSADEMKKIAEGLQIDVLDEVVPYATEAEVQAELEKQKAEEVVGASKEIPKEQICSLGEEVISPLTYENQEIHFVVNSAELRDHISFDEFPKENFKQGFVEWVNEDGTMKPHDRVEEGADHKEAQHVHAKFLVVHMTAKNVSKAAGDQEMIPEISVAPDLVSLEKDNEGNYQQKSSRYHCLNEGYGLQYGSNDGSSFPVYFDRRYYTEGKKGLKSGLFRPLAAGEQMEYTLIYLVDEDQVQHTALWFGDGAAQLSENERFVVVTESK